MNYSNIAMKTINLDIIIVNFNSTDYTIECINSIRKKSGLSNYTINVVDNCSTDDPERIKKIFPEIDLINNTKNIGFGRAVNRALQMTNGELILLLNPDSVFSNGKFNEIIDFIKKNKNIAIVGPKVLDYDGEIQGSARRFPNILTSIFGRKSPITKFFPNNSIIRKQFPCFGEDGSKPIIVDWVSGACMLAKRKALEQINGFDRQFFLYWEDADLCRRLKKKGWLVAYHPAAEIVHHVGKSSDSAPVFSIYQFHKSSYLLYTKDLKRSAKILKPFAFLGLSLRCLFVIGLSYYQKILHQKYAKRRNKRRRDLLYHQKKRARVLRIVSRLNVGGPSIHCSILLKGLDHQRFDTTMVTGSLSKHEGDMSYLINGNNGLLIKIPELQREISILKDFFAFLKISRIIFKEKPDIVHSHLAKAGAVGRLAVLLCNLIDAKKIKTVHTFHGHVLDGYFTPMKSKIFLGIEKILAMSTDAIIAISKTQMWELTEKYKLVQAEKVHIVNLGFDLSKFMNYRPTGVLRSNLKVDDKTLLVGIVGRLVPIKNHRLFLDAAKLVKDRFHDRSIRFVIVGDGELRADLEAYAREINVQDEVVFYGWVKEIQHVYADLDMLLLTSNNEGTPVSIIEAMASMVPVVTTGVGGIKDLLGNIEAPINFNGNSFNICERGLLCPRGDAHSIADGLEYLMENDSHDMCARAKDFVIEKYTDTQLLKNIERLYDELVGKKN
jgi:GT2 family glycosyltransferase